MRTTIKPLPDNASIASLEREHPCAGMRVALVVAGPPQPKERARRGKGGRFYTPKRTQQYEAAVRNVATLGTPAGWPGDARYSVTVVAYFADGRHRDVDNVAKAALDGMQGICFRNDAQVIRLVSERGGIDRANPRTEIVVEVMGALAPGRAQKGRAA